MNLEKFEALGQGDKLSLLFNAVSELAAHAGLEVFPAEEVQEVVDNG